MFPGYQPYPTPVPSSKERFIELLKKHCLPINKFINEHIQIGVDDLTNLDHSRFVELCTFFKLNPVEKIRFEKLVNELSFGEEQFNHNDKASIDTYNHNKTIATSKNESLLIQQLDNEHEKMQYISRLAEFMMNRTNDKCSLCHDQINKIFDAQKEKIINLLQTKQQQLHDDIREFQHKHLVFIQNQLKTIDEYQADIRQTRSACSTVLESQQYGEDREDTIAQIIQSLLSMHADHNIYRNIKQLNKRLGEISKEVRIEYEPMIMETCVNKIVLIEPTINDDSKAKIMQIHQICNNSNHISPSYRHRTRSEHDHDSLDMNRINMHHYNANNMHHMNPFQPASLSIYSNQNRPQSISSAPMYNSNHNNSNPQTLYHHHVPQQLQQANHSNPDIFSDVHHTKRASYGSYNHFKEHQNQAHFISQPQLRNRPHSFAYNDAKLYDNISLFSAPNMKVSGINELEINDEHDNGSSILDIQPPLPRYSPPPFGSVRSPGRSNKALSFSQAASSSITHINPPHSSQHHSFQIQHSIASSASSPNSNRPIKAYALTLTQSESNHDDVDIQALLMETIDLKDEESDDEHARSIEAMYEPGTTGNTIETQDIQYVSNPKKEEKENVHRPDMNARRDIGSIDITNSDYLDCNPHEILNELNEKPPFMNNILASSVADTRSRPLSIQSASSQHASKWAVYGVGDNTLFQFGLNHNNMLNDFVQMNWDIDESKAAHSLSAYILNANSNASSIDIHEEEEEEKEIIDRTNGVPVQRIKKTWTDCVTSMASGPEWSLFLFSNGALYCSGRNASGCFSMGKEKKGTYIQTLTQHPFFDSNDICIRYASKGCASHHSFVITDKNELYGIGESSHYQLALDSEQMAKNKTNFWPQKISFFNKIQIARISCGKKFTIFVGEDGVTYSCGSNLFGALGFCDEVTTIKKPRVIEKLHRAKAIHVVCGENHSILLDSSGKIWSWGINNQGQLGRNTKNNLDYPGIVPIGSRKFVVGQSQSRMNKIASGTNHVAVISESSKLYIWGCNESGQLGDGTQKARYKPKPLLLKNELIKDVQCGSNHTVIITKQRKVFVCGCNEYYQCQQQIVKSNKKYNHRNVILKPRLLTFENQPDIDQQIKSIFAAHNGTFVAVDTNMDIDRVCV